jgi:hypothetical protein
VADVNFGPFGKNYEIFRKIFRGSKYAQYGMLQVNHWTTRSLYLEVSKLALDLVISKSHG